MRRSAQCERSQSSATVSTHRVRRCALCAASRTVVTGSLGCGPHAAALRWAQGRVQGTLGTLGGACMCASQEAAFATLAAQPSWQQSAPKPIRNGRRTATVTSVPYLGVLAAVLAAAEICTSQRGRRQSEATLLAVLVIAV